MQQVFHFKLLSPFSFALVRKLFEIVIHDRGEDNIENGKKKRANIMIIVLISMLFSMSTFIFMLSPLFSCNKMHRHSMLCDMIWVVYKVGMLWVRAHLNHPDQWSIHVFNLHLIISCSSQHQQSVHRQSK